MKDYFLKLFFQYISTHSFKRVLFLLASAVIILLVPFQLSAQDAQPTMAPLNPEFVNYMATRGRVKGVQVAPAEHAMGLEPSPIDISHMTGQHPAPPPGAHPTELFYAASYDLRTLGKVTPVKDQGSCGACWTFATMASLESKLTTDDSWDFSENNLDDTNGYNAQPCAGGNYVKSTSYLARWSGPWTEAADPYTTTTNKQSPTYPSPNAQKHVQEVLWLPNRGSSTDNDNIKWALSTHGAVMTAVYMDTAGYYNSTYKAYYYNGANTINHGVTIVGWDDNFAASKFKTAPPGNGAFIVKNSWGTSWGETGYFYVSYYDSHLKDNAVFIGAESNSNYYRVYQYDPLGNTSATGYGSGTGWFANFFTAADANTQVDAVSFYTAALNSSYTVYIYVNPAAGSPRSGTLMSSQSGSFAYAGYHTVPLTTKVPLTNGQTFTVVAQMTTPGYNWPIPMEIPIANYSSEATASLGQSYISSVGTTWTDLNATTPNRNVNLKAFTSRINNDPTPPSNVTTVYDGATPGVDINAVTSLTELSANWTAAGDGESGIRRYWYAIGTTPGGTNVRNWTDAGNVTAVTRTGLTLAGGQTYYFSVKAENWVGLPSAVTSSNGQAGDSTPPTAPGAVYDGSGIGTDIAYSNSSLQLSANWTASSDPESGVARYYYAIGTSAGAANVVGWTDNGAATTVTRAGLSLSNGQMYYFTVKALNGADMESGVTNSNGQRVDTTAPTSPASVNDGTVPGTDITYINSASELSATWAASADSESGVVRYLYAIGTSAGATNVVGWTDNGTATSVTRAGLSLTNGQIYYFTVEAENGVGLPSGVTNSNGQTVDTTVPSAPGAVNDSTGTDITYTNSASQLSANWTTASDAQSGIAKYWYAIGTTAGATNVKTWGNNGTATSVTELGLSLTNGQIYYFTVKAENGVVLPSGVTNSNGQTVDNTVPSAPGTVYDGAGIGTDIAYTSSSSQLSANWTAAADAQSGIAKYLYAIGTTAGAADVTAWTDNGLNTSVTKAGLSLTSGQLYYFTVKAQNGAGAWSSVLNSNGQRVDTSVPTSPAPVNDGTGIGTDITYVNSTTQLSANWTTSTDAQSGIAKYLYAIGTTAGGTNIVGWTNNGANTSITKSGLSLTNGQIYYFTVKAENGAGLQTAAANSNGQTVDTTAPSAPGTVNDGTGADISYSSSSSQLSANWTAASDAQSGIARYGYVIGTTPGAGDVLGLTDNGANTSITKTGLNLTNGQIYYFTVGAENGVGLQSVATISNGQTVDTTVPSAPGTVYDGAGIGADIAYTNSPSQLSANWTAASDAQSGIAKYLYAIGTTAGGTNIVGWTDNGTNISVTKTGLSLTSGQLYYFTVKAQNGAGGQSSVLNSNGQRVDTTAPTSPSPVNDGTGTDITYVNSTTQLSANWTASSDAESGLVRYWYAIGTTAGGTNIVGWTDNGANTSITKSGLSLANGQIYYFTVKAENGAGLQTTPVNSSGQTVDTTAPSAPGAVNDSTGADITYVNSNTQLSANWTAASDAQSGIAKYGYTIGTTPGGWDVVGLTDNGANTSVTKSGLSLTEGQIYYFTVGAENGVGLQSSAVSSNGQLVDTSPPLPPGAVNDGTGADITYTNSASQLSANWTAASDALSGVAKYWYAIGTTAGATNIVGWTDNGTNISVTKTGLSLSSGQLYYFTVKAQNGTGAQSSVLNSNGQRVDTSAPTSPAPVNDGTGADITYLNSSTELSANWTAASDAESGLVRYLYAIGTTAGGTNIVGWTDNGTNTSVTKAGLSLTNGQIYYFTVKAENGAGLQTTPANSSGQTLDTTAPSAPGAVNDGAGADITYTNSASQLSANWTAASDTQSGIAKYWYAIGTTAGGTNILTWTDNGTNTSVTKTGLSLTSGQIYYFTVKAENGANAQSSALNSNGQLVDTTAPTSAGGVNDGTGADVTYVNSSTQLSANWTAASDAQSGIAKYWYAIGTTAGGTNVTGWTDNNNVTSVTKAGLSLANGGTYYFTVKAENGAGLQSGVVNSNGQTVDTTPPSSIASVNDSTGADVSETGGTIQLSANWTSASDTQSGIAKYWYAIGTTAGGTDIVTWTDNGANIYVTKKGLSLTDGVMYYFTVKAENGMGLQTAATNSNGQVVNLDVTPPINVPQVRDGTGADSAWSGSQSQLSANWDASSDAQSDIARYWYAIGTTAGGVDVAGWTDNDANTSVTRTGLGLTDGQAYYFTVKAENGAGLQSGITNSNSQTVDISSSSTPGAVNDGMGADVTHVNSNSQLSANWTAASDAQSGIAKYWYAIGTAAGGTDVTGWTDNGTNTSVTKTGLSLTDGQTYYFTLKAENGARLQTTPVNSNGQTADTTAPSTPGAINDGTGADVLYAISSSQLSANWTASSDPHSGIAKYWYAIGTTAGGANITGWTNNGANTSVTKNGLSLTDGQVYYFTVKAENGAGLQSGVVNSNGQTVDTSSPSTPATVNDGTGADVTYVNSNAQLSANWTASSDPHSGIAGYWYAIGTTAGGTDTTGWTDNGTNTSVTKNGLSLTDGQTYYFTLKAENGAGLQSVVANSNGQTVDTSSPSTPGALNDGTGADVAYVNSATQLSANWTAASDTQSGIAKYWYAIGTTAGGTNVTGWTNNGTSTSVTKNGLSLTDGQIYYFTVKAENGMSLQSPPVNSNGQTADTTAPSNPGSVNDGTGADIAWSASLTQLSANWTASSDPHSGIAGYWYAIGTFAGGTDFITWTDNGTGTSFTRTGLTLVDGNEYFVTVKAENGAGLQSGITNSNGQTIDPSAPSTTGTVNDGTGADVTYTISASQLSANWTAASDAQSGIARYWYAIGTTAGATNTTGWTDNGANTSVTKTGLSLANGAIYYFTLKAENGAGTQSSVVNSDGQLVDTTAPTSPGPVNDGAGADITYVNSATQLSANWTASSDAESGLVRYLYAIGTTAGATNTTGWTDNGANTSVTKTGLSLTDGGTYYFTVKAENGAGLQTTPVNSNGQTADTTAPSNPGSVNDGTGADIAWAASLTQLSANWTASSDVQSGIAKYWYAIGTTAGGTEVAGWTDNGADTSVTSTGLNLDDAQTYYFTVKAENRAGLQSGVTNSNGQTIDPSAPSTTGPVNDGTGADVTYTISASQLSANWTAASDAQSGIARYWYAIGTTAGATNTTGWTDNGANTSVTKTGLSLANGAIYYFTLKAENGAGTQSSVVNSDGQLVDTTAPTSPGPVNDGAGADITYVNSATQLSANWTASSDAESGLVRYLYAIGTTAGATNTTGWTDNGANTSVTKTGLSLTDGGTYYFTVKAENGAGLQTTPVNSSGQTADTTAPSAPGAVNDGTSADISYSSSSSQLSANWTAASDAQSGIARYWYAIGATPGGITITGWIDNGANTSVTKTGLTLANGGVYYFTVKAENGAGIQSSTVNSTGQLVDTTAPTSPGPVNDGTGTDITYVNSATQLSANWTASSDAESGLVRYLYAIGTTAGGTNTTGWTDNGTSTSVTKTGLSLTNGGTYYFTVKAENGSGLQTTPVNSTGQTVDTTPPSTIVSVNDGTGADIAVTGASSRLAANWTAASDAQSGIVKYWYAIGATAGGTNIVGWTDNGTGTSVIKNGLTLTDGAMYYFTVKAENGVGLQAAATNSNGQLVDIDITPPTNVPQVRDGTGADSAWAGSPTQLSANWDASSDPESAIAKYYYAIGTTVGGIDISGWTDNGNLTSATKTGLNLTDGQAYYFTVKAENEAELLSGVTNSNGQTIDLSSPSTTGAVSDGTGADITYTSSSSQLSANWTAASDAQSGIARYWYAIGTTAGGSNTTGWTDNGAATSVTKTGLSLDSGQIYYFTVKAENAAGLQSSAVNSSGQTVDTSAPSPPGAVNDGASADITYSSSPSQLSANWTAASDAQSGIAKYYYAIGTTAGGTEVTGWTDNGTSTSVTKTGLSLASGQLYYFTIKAQNGAGTQSSAVNSNGQRVDTTAPTSPGPVNDGAGADITYISSSTQLSANWTASTDPESGLVRYLYAIGTSAGAANIVGWTDNGANTSVTKTGLNLTSGQIYYFTVKAENGAGIQALAVNSNGQRVDTTAPISPGPVNDGTGGDIVYTSSSSQLSANWSYAFDAQSGIAKYWYAIGTTAGGTDRVPWTDNGNVASVVKTGLALNNGYTYYFTVKAENGAGLQSGVTNSNGQTVDNTAPSVPGAVNDGPDADISETRALTQLSANWGAGSDAQSGIAKYWYAIGTTAGGMNIRGWIDNGTGTFVTKTGLNLTNGQTYYFTVKTENGSGLQSAPVNSNGQTVNADLTPPSDVAHVRDGLVGASAWAGSLTQLSANWDAATDWESGIDSYEYAIGTNAGESDVLGWTSNGANISVTATGLSLENDLKYYFMVRAKNGASLYSNPVYSAGQLVDASPPYTPSPVNDGESADIDYTNSASQLSVNWAASSDPQSGLGRYLYAIGTTAGAADITPWTDNGLSTSVTRTGLTLSDAQTYYFSVKAENTGAGQSVPANSDGQMVDLTPPSAPAAVNDGPGADIGYSTSAAQLSANWTPAADALSGIARYLYAIGTTAGAVDIAPWTNNGPSTAVTRTGLNLVEGGTYYFSVKAVNGAGLESGVRSSDGQVLTGLSENISPVNDGLGTDIDYVSSLNTLSANWNASHHPSGIAEYLYAIGTSAGAINVLGWTSNGTATSVTRTGLSLSEGTIYYFAVKPRPNQGIISSPVISSGQKIDTASPTARVELTPAPPLKSGAFTAKLTITETNPLSAPPSLYFMPSAGSERPIPLSQVSPGVWSGDGFIESQCSSGTASFSFSASDLAGNSGATITEGATFLIDTSVSAASGGTVANSDGSTVILPAAAYPSSLWVTISTPAASITSSIDSRTHDSVGLRGIVLTREFTATDSVNTRVSNFNRPVTIRLNWPDADNDGRVDGDYISEDLLRLYYLDPVLDKWVTVEGMRKNTTLNTLEADVPHFSIYSIRSLPSGEQSMDSIKAYPNPCYMENDNLTISGIPVASAGVKILIYNAAGELVRTLKPGDGIDNFNVGTWDGRNSSGDKAASGLYIYLAKTGNNGKATGKFAILW